MKRGDSMSTFKILNFVHTYFIISSILITSVRMYVPSDDSDIYNSSHRRRDSLMRGMLGAGTSGIPPRVCVDCLTWPGSYRAAQCCSRPRARVNWASNIVRLRVSPASQSEARRATPDQWEAGSERGAPVEIAGSHSGHIGCQWIK